MVKKVLAMIFSLLIPMCFVSLGEAKPPKTARFEHADKNNDGTIDKKEWRMEHQREQGQRSRVNTWWEKRADTNNDGKVDDSELSAWKQLTKERIDLNNDGVIDPKERRLCWRHGRSKVNTALEQKYDANGDGWLEAAEVKELLKDRAQIIKTEGKAKVDSGIEEEYDANNDGVIDASEAGEMKGDCEK